MIVGMGTKRVGVIAGAGLLLAGLSPHLAAAEEPGLWSTPVSEAELAVQSGREGVLVYGEDHVVGIADAKADIGGNTMGDVESFGDVGDVTIERNHGITTNMINTGAYSNMVNTNAVTVNFINVAPNGQ